MMVEKIENQSDLPKPETWKSKKSKVEGKWYSAISIPFIWFEWVCEWVAFGLKKWAFIEILENLGKLSVIVGIVLFISERDEREKNKYYQAWQVINTAQGKIGEGGRIDAIEDLVSQGHSLQNLDVSDGYLRFLDIGSDDQDKDQVMAWGANFACTDLKGANLRGVRFSTANFRGSLLHYADLRDTKLDYAHFECAELIRANLEKANLTGAFLEKANFCGANLRGANLSNVENWRQIYCIRGANLTDLTGVPYDSDHSDGFRTWAYSNGAIIDGFDPTEGGTENVKKNEKSKCGTSNNLEDWKCWQRKLFDTGDLNDEKLQKYYDQDNMCKWSIENFNEKDCCKEKRTKQGVMGTE